MRNETFKKHMHNFYKSIRDIRQYLKEREQTCINIYIYLKNDISNMNLLEIYEKYLSN